MSNDLKVMPEGVSSRSCSSSRGDYCWATASYELLLLAATPVLGGASSFTPAIVARLGLTGAAWLAGLVATCEIVRLLAPRVSRRAMS